MQAAGRSMVTAVVVVVGVFTVTTTAHIMELGTCRDFKGMDNFDPVRFNGTWYVIKKVSTKSNCLTVDYKLMEDDQSFRVEEIRRPPFTDVTPIDLSITNAGMLISRGSPAEYSVTWFNGIIPLTGTFTVVDTDYDTYAVDYECQEFFGFLRRVSATISSKTKEMDADKLEELTQMVVNQYEIPRDRLNMIDQDSCIALDANDFNLVVDEEGLRSALRDYKAIEKLSQLPLEEAAEVVHSLS